MEQEENHGATGLLSSAPDMGHALERKVGSMPPRCLSLRENAPVPSRRAKFQVEVLADTSAVAALADELDGLAQNSSEPNVFYESWMLRPALKAFGNKAPIVFVAVRAIDSGKEPVLCGFFPLEILHRYRGLPLKAARLWTFLHFNWCVPLLRKGLETQTFEAFFLWAASGESPCSLIEFGHFPVEGNIARAFVEVMNRFCLPTCLVDLSKRAVLLNRGDAKTYLSDSISGRKLKEYGRLGRRLAERGTITYQDLHSEEHLSEWIDGFLKLESAGWKGKAGTALASSPEQKEFFRSALTDAFYRGQLMMLRLRVGAHTIAYKCNFLSKPGAFAFKIAYDEHYGSFSPGVLLELENIRRFQTGNLVWMDSCANPEHFMANHLWSDRRILQTTLVATRGLFAGFVTAALPLAKWSWRCCRSSMRRNHAEPAQ